MGFSFSGHAAQAGHDNLQELLAAQLQEEMLRENQAQQDRQIGQTDQRIALDERQLGQQAAQAAASNKLRERELDEDATRYRSENNLRGVLDMQRQAEFMARQEAAAKAEADYQGLQNDPSLTADEKKALRLSKITGKEFSRAEVEDPETALQREIRLIEARNASEARHRAPREGAGGGADAVKAQKAATAAMNMLDKLDTLSKEINTETGPWARVQGAMRTGAATVGLDDRVTEYNGMLGVSLPGIARELGHVGVLTQQDVESVLTGLPKPNSTKGERDLLIGNIKDLIGRRLQEYEARTGQRLERGGGGEGGGGAAPAADDPYQAYLASRKKK